MEDLELYIAKLKQKYAWKLHLAAVLLLIFKLIKRTLSFNDVLHQIPGFPILANFTIFRSLRLASAKGFDALSLMHEMCQGICEVFHEEKIWRMWVPGSSLVNIYGFKSVQCSPVAEQVLKNIKETPLHIYRRFMRPWLWPDVIYRRTQRGKAYYRAIDAMNTIIKKNIDRKVAENKLNKGSESDKIEKDASKYQPLLDFLMEKHSEDPTFTEKDVHDELKLFIYAESHRLYPPIPGISRTTTDDLKTANFEIPKGTPVTVNIFKLHRDPEIYPDPEKFIPERFLPEISTRIKTYTYMPFSTGPRDCIGKQLAILVEKVVLSHLLLNYKFESLDPRDKVLLNSALALNPKSTIRLKLHPRSITK